MRGKWTAEPILSLLKHGVECECVLCFVCFEVYNHTRCSMSCSLDYYEPIVVVID